MELTNLYHPTLLAAETAARQCAEVLDALDGGAILEIGAGSGKLAADMLETLEALGAVPEVYRILEVSADLRERQQNYFLGKERDEHPAESGEPQAQ